MTDKAQAKQRIEELRTEIERHNQLYYRDAKPEIEDYEFDALLHELIQLENKNPEYFDPNSPTQRVGGSPSEGFKRIKHASRMMSLANAFNFKDLNLFRNRIIKAIGSLPFSYVVEPKIDGVSINLRYEKGILVLATTRGDGEYGDDVTANVKTIKSIPLKLLNIDSPPQVLEARGEIYMLTKEFDAFNEELGLLGKDPFKNPRNACAGTLKQLDPKEVAKRPLDAVFYGAGELKGISFETQIEMLRYFASVGLRTSLNFSDSMFRDTGQYWQEMFNKDQGCLEVPYFLNVLTQISRLDIQRHEFPFEIDGAVIKINQRRYYDEISGTGKYPNWAIAFKYPPEQAITTLLSITPQVGRTGIVTPVAELEPVELAGTTVKRATLHNETQIRKKDIRPGDKVLIQKAGEIIPEVVRPLPRSSDTPIYQFPTMCPECNEPLEPRETRKLEQGTTVIIRTWFCVNLQCPAQLKTWLEHFSSRGALDIEGIGGIVADKLIEHGLVKTPLDLYSLPKRELSTLNLGTEKEPRVFGEKNATKVIKALEESKRKPFGKWLSALGIPKIGSVSANSIAQQHNGFDELKNSKTLIEFAELFDLQSEIVIVNPQSNNYPCKSEEDRIKRAQRVDEINDRMEELAPELLNIGWISQVDTEEKKPTPICLRHQYIKTDVSPNPEAVRSLLKYLNSDKGALILDHLTKLGITFTQSTTGSSLSGKKFVLTGTLNKLKRDEAKDLILEQGGSVSGSISKNTDYLIAGENAGSKLDKALSLGVEVLSEDDFLKMIGTSAENTDSTQSEPIPSQGELW